MLKMWGRMGYGLFIISESITVRKIYKVIVNAERYIGPKAEKIFYFLYNFMIFRSQFYFSNIILFL